MCIRDSKIDLPSSYGNVSATFNVTDLSLFDAADSRTNPFEQGGNDGGSWHENCSNEEHGMEQGTQAQRWRSNVPKDPLQGIGGPMTRARTKAMNEALNCLITELKELEPIHLEDACFNMIKKSPRMVITLLKAPYVSVQGPCGVQIEEFP